MSGLPVVSGRATASALCKIGYEVVRQRGSHMRLKHPTDKARLPVTVPDHKELKPGTLRSILRDAALTIEQFRELL
jgi:predicted RNA binding protein YcfA (HicA-like mRNA interferase family)